MESLMTSETLRSYEHECFNTSWGTSWELVGKKNLELKRVVRKIRQAVQLRAKVKSYLPQIVHFHCGSGGIWDFPGDMLMFMSAKASGAKTIIHWHREPFLSKFPGKSPFTKAFFDGTAGTADALIVLSKEYRIAIQNNALWNKTYVVPNAFDQALLDIPCPRDAKNPVSVIYIGRLTREKGIFDLLEVASMTLRLNSNVRFIFAGTPSPAEGGLPYLEEMIINIGLERYINIIGSVSGKEKLAFFRDGDVLLFPSHRESFGIAVLEAMASGLPVVAYSIGMLPELIKDSASGFLVPPGNKTKLSSRMLELVESPNLRACMGQIGRDQVRGKYSLTAVATKVKEIYESLVEDE
jgi:glycosyltransferase involved in cell wall biosynthesis